MNPGVEILYRLLLLTGWENYAESVWADRAEWLEIRTRLNVFRKWKNRSRQSD